MTKSADHFPSRGLVQLIALAAVVVMGACAGGGGDDGAATPEGTGGSAPSTSSDTAADSESGPVVAWAEDKCSIVSVDDVGAAVGEAVSARDYPPSGCQYTGTDPVSRTAVVIDYYNDGFECELVESMDDDVEVVQGLGAHAVNGSSGTGGVLAVTLDDDRCFFVHGESRAVAEAVMASANRDS